MKSLIATTAFALSLVATADAAIVIELDPERARQKVQWGADVKLTIKAVDAGNTKKVIERFDELGMTLIRLPIFATRKPSDKFNRKVDRVAKLAHEAGMEIFLSLANGDGSGRNLHHGSKFGEFLKSKDSKYLYNIGPTKYGRFLRTHVDRLKDQGVPVAVLGPFNEDPAKAGAYRAVFEAMGSRRFKRIGLETWSLKKGLKKARSLVGAVDIVGAHCYDDDKIIPDGIWYELSRNSEGETIWFTESTRYRDSGDTMTDTRTGIEHFIPAIRGGAECVIIYQTAGRIVKYDGSVRTRKFGSLKHFIANSRGQVIGSRVDSDEISTVSFRDEFEIQTHVTHRGDQAASVSIQLLGPRGFRGEAAVTSWTDESNVAAKESVELSPSGHVVFSAPPNSYSQVSVNLAQ